MSDATSDPVVCHNCRAELHGPFCAQCGQEALPLNPRLRDVAGEFVHELADMDGRIFRSVRKLFLAPGFLTREHFEGRRAPWLSPVRLYLIFSVAYFAIASIAGPGAAVRIQTTGGEDAQGIQSLGYKSEEELRQAVGSAMATWMPRVMFVLVPLFAALVHVVRRRRGNTYPQHLLFALHVHAAVFGVASLLMLLRMTVPDSVMGAEGGRGIVVIFASIYLFMAFRAAYGGTKGQAFRQTLFVMLIYGFALILATAAIVVPTILGRQHSGNATTRFSWNAPGAAEAQSKTPAAATQPQQQSQADQWPAYGGDAGGNRYSPLTQVTPANVKGLQVAWTYRTGELGENAESGKSLTFEATPIHFDGRLHLSTSYGKVIALDPASGKEIWTYDAKIDRKMDYSEVTSRGVSSWRDAKATGEAANAACATRIFLGTIDARLIALDAKTGQPCAGFGAGGMVNLKTGVHTPSTEGDYQVTSPPAILGDHVIVGSSIGDNWNIDTGSGIVRAFDARTGAQRWSWQPVPRENAKGGQVGAANAWSMMSVDAARDLVFVPTTSPSPDFFGGMRAGTNADANSVVALRGSTGERVWAFQTVHHDLWDYDLAAQPALVTVTHGGRQIPAVAQATKMGSIFLLDRLTGAPVWPVEERPVPKTDIAGETSSPTQPFTTKPRSLMPIGPITPETVWGINDQDRAECRALAAQYRSEGIFTPPSLRGTIMWPGNGSGVNWGSVAVDQSRQLLIANTSRYATLVQMIARADFDRMRTESAKKGEDYEYGAHRGAPFGMRRKTFAASTGVPCTQPPWGTLTVVDLATGDIKWEVPLGKVPDEHPRRAEVGDQAIGVPNSGGPLVTASGLIFIGATLDSYFRAVDLESGKELWSTKLPRAGIATPMTYQATDGRQNHRHRGRRSRQDGPAHRRPRRRLRAARAVLRQVRAISASATRGSRRAGRAA